MYDFNRINDKDFENLSIDILSKLTGERIERFKIGKDQGIDGRFYSAERGTTIVQCKHWLRSGWSRLASHLRTEEIQKVRKLNPKRYILTTTVPLSPANKAELIGVFAPFILSPQDIYGVDEITAIIAADSDLEQRHFKLWLSSASVLQGMLNNAEKGRSKHKLEEMSETVGGYVITEAYSDAARLIDKLNVVIISGEPGIGKTTVASQICLSLAAKKFEFIAIEESITEAEKTYLPEKNQLFYFDDFMGRNFFEALKKHEDSHVINFIKRVTRDKTKKFVLTSRSAILNQGKRLSDLFEIEKTHKNEYVIHIDTYSRMTRAKILYNHIWHSKLPPAFVGELYKDRRYLKIIDHKNYNPRIIQFITDPDRFSSITPEAYWENVMRMLENPAEIWAHVLANQLDEGARNLLFIVVFNGKKIEEKELRVAYQRWLDVLPVGHQAVYRDINYVLKVVVGSVLNRWVKEAGKEVFYDLFNPSIADYVIHNFSHDKALLGTILNCLATVESLRNLSAMGWNNNITKDLGAEILDRLVLTQFPILTEKDISYGTILAADALSVGSVSEKGMQKILEFLQNVLMKTDKHFPLDSGWEIFAWALDDGVFDDQYEELLSRLLKLAKDWLMSKEEQVQFAKLLKNIGERYGISLQNELKLVLEEVWIETIKDEIESSGILDEFYEYSDSQNMEEYLETMLIEHYSECGLELDREGFLRLADRVDMKDIIDSNSDRASYGDSESISGRDADDSKKDGDADIVDLFDSPLLH